MEEQNEKQIEQTDSQNENQIDQPVENQVCYYKNINANLQPKNINDPNCNGNRKKKKTITPKQNSIANILCIVSLLLLLAVPTVLGIAAAQYDDQLMDLAAFNFSALSIFVAWIIMVVVRVKYKENTFGKILMWIYIIIVAVAVVAIVLIIAACIYIGSIFHSCIPPGGLW